MINFITGIESTSAALQAERVRMAVASENMANANTTKGLDGLPYQRQSVVFESVLANEELGFAGISPQKVQISRIEKDQSGPRMVYNPGHPDADSTGMVAMPNVNIHEEMADYIVSSRAYEANLAVVRNARAMAVQTLQIGKA
ncbi:MAG TPA: flagellar basal body rod protein FlgC [Verrucomicrobiae bacterium]|jgi:flagellar basal-body rod protein FlgC